MIEKIYEVTCDYCLSAIYHGCCSSAYTVKYIKENNLGYVKGSHHFCSEECYKKWLENGKKDIIS